MSGSITRWIEQLKEGDREGVQLLWALFFRRLVALARKELITVPRRAMVERDEEDVALSAFRAFCDGVENGRLPLITDRNGLWECLLVVTRHKALDLMKRVSADKRNYDRVLANGGEVPAVYEIISRELDPGYALELTDTMRHLIASCEDADRREIASLHFQGLSVGEISNQIDVSPSTVRRKLHLIRRHWEKMMHEDSLGADDD